MLAEGPYAAASSAAPSLWPTCSWMKPGNQVSALKQSIELQIKLKHFFSTRVDTSPMRVKAVASAVTCDWMSITCKQTTRPLDIFPVLIDIFHFQLSHIKLFWFSALLGFCLNGLTIISFRKIKELRTPSNLLVLSIALADCGICINAFIAAFSSFLRYVLRTSTKQVKKQTLPPAH